MTSSNDLNLSTISNLTAPVLQPYLDTIPTAFNSELTMLQKVNKILSFLQTVQDSNNTMIDQWNNDIVPYVTGSGLQTDVDNQLTTWKNDGTLKQIIGSDVYANKADKSIVDNIIKNRINPLSYGADPLGVSDSSSAFQQAFQAVIDLSVNSNVSIVLYIPSGHYILGDLPEFSFNSNTNGGYTNYCRNNVVVMAEGARFEHNGMNDMFFFQGNPSNDFSLKWFGGKFKGNNNTKSLIKSRDSSRFSFIIESMDNVPSGRCFLFQNWYAWTENLTVTGYPLSLTNYNIGVQLQSASNSASYENTTNAGGTDSFARFRCYNGYSNNGSFANSHLFKIDGGAYDSFIYNWGGNADNQYMVSLFEITGRMANSAIYDIRFEGANNSAYTSYIVNVTGGNTRPNVRSISWTGGYAIPTNGLNETQQTETIYNNVSFKGSIFGNMQPLENESKLATDQLNLSAVTWTEISTGGSGAFLIMVKAVNGEASAVAVATAHGDAGAGSVTILNQDGSGGGSTGNLFTFQWLAGKQVEIQYPIATTVNVTIIGSFHP